MHLQDSPKAGAGLASQATHGTCQELEWEDNVPSLQGGGDALLGAASPKPRCLMGTSGFNPTSSRQSHPELSRMQEDV